jgi:segregation and condensation protein A
LPLVHRRRLPIAELSLAAVADQYLAQVRALPVLQPDALSEFLAMAARLLLLKSRALLPAIEPPPGPEGDEETDAADLVRRLEAYRVFRDLAAQIGERDAIGPLSFSGGARPVEATVEPAALQAIAPALLASLYDAIERRRAMPEADVAETVTRISVAERIALLRGRITTVGYVAWNDICGATVDEIVATLLAVLELVRRGEMAIDQPALFGPITLRRPEPAPETA